MIKNVTLKISDISCEKCVQAVDNTIKGLPGIISMANIKSSTGRTEVEVCYETETVSFYNIRDAINVITVTNIGRCRHL